MPTKLAATGAGQRTIELLGVMSLQMSLCDVTSEFKFHVVPFLATFYSVLLGQEILGKLGLKIDCGDDVFRASGSQQISASELIVISAQEGIHP